MSGKALRISRDLALPLEAVTESIAILAKRRVGKSYTGRVFVEKLFGAGQQFVVVDPKGDWWGIRSSADGKSPGLPIVIVGGEHSDIPLEVGGGELVARLLVEQRVSMLIDLSALRKGEVKTFMAAFLETLYRLKARDQFRTPLMVVVDEADAIAPQRPDDGEQRMLGAIEDLVRRGGQRGIGVMLISQRAAVLNKNVLTQCGILILLRTMGSQDIEAVDTWIKKHGQPAERAVVMQEIASLPIGTAWVWAPGWPDDAGIFQRVEIAPIATFDSGKTPKPGEVQRAPKTLADVNLDVFRAEMAATIERAKADDPKALKAQVAQLTRERDAARKTAPVTVVPPILEAERIEVPVVTDAQIARIEQLMDRVVASEAKAFAMLEGQQAAWREAAGAAKELAAAVRSAALPGTQATVRPPAAAARPVTPQPAPRSTAASPDGHAPAIGRTERNVLTVLLQHGSLTYNQIALLAGYSPTASTIGVALAKLRRLGLVDARGEPVSATPEGGAALGGQVEPLPTGPALLEYWRNRFGATERNVLDAFIAAHPATTDHLAISAATGYSATASTIGVALGKLRRVGVIDRWRLNEDFARITGLAR